VDKEAKWTSEAGEHALGGGWPAGQGFGSLKKGDILRGGGRAHLSSDDSAVVGVEVEHTPRPRAELWVAKKKSGQDDE
jgi:hypothetical protein